MKRLILLITLAAISLTGCSYQTLEQAIDSKWDYPVTIMLKEDTRNGVIFKDNDQYVFNTYEEKGGSYRYTTDGEDGWTFTGGNPPLLVRTIYRPESGAIVWGAVKTQKKLKEIKITFVSRDNQQDQFSMTIPIRNNVFIGYPDQALYQSEAEAATRWRLDVVLYDENGNVVEQRPQ